MSFRLPAALLAVLLLAFPAGAVAQSAGDEQYADPFSEAPAGEGEATPEQEQPASPPAADVPANPVVQEPEAAAPEAAAPEAQASSDTGIALPRTGLPVGILAAAGALMAAGGYLVRRRA